MCHDAEAVDDKETVSMCTSGILSLHLHFVLCNLHSFIKSGRKDSRQTVANYFS